MGLGIRTAIRRRRAEKEGASYPLVQTYLSDAPTRGLHLGCGHNLLPGWLNSDLSASNPNVFPLDATKRLPFDDDTFDYVYSEHFIEHITLADGQALMRECHRILKPGGVVRITTPDLAFLIALCREPKTDLQRDYVAWATREFLPNAPSARDVYVLNNYFYSDWGHKFIYDNASLKETLELAGFDGIEFCKIRESGHAFLRDLEFDGRMPAGFLALESQTIEGTKPA